MHIIVDFIWNVKVFNVCEWVRVYTIETSGIWAISATSITMNGRWLVTMWLLDICANLLLCVNKSMIFTQLNLYLETKK